MGLGCGGCLTHTSVIGGPESGAAGLAVEGAEGVDTDTAGTGSGISALIYICTTRRWGMKNNHRRY